MNKNSSHKLLGRLKIPAAYQHHRQNIGKHMSWQAKRQPSQRDQDELVKRLARTPGRHYRNMDRQNVAHAMVQLVAILSSVEICRAGALTRSKANATTSLYKSSERTFKSANLANWQEPRSALSSNMSLAHSSRLDKFPALVKSSRGLTHQNILKQKIYSSRLKRSQPFSNNISYEIAKVLQDGRFDYELRSTLDIILRFAKGSSEVRESAEELRNLMILLKCIQQLHLFIKINKLSGNWQEMLDALIMIADNLESPAKKVLVNQFKKQFISESITARTIRMYNSRGYDFSNKMHLIGDNIVFSRLDELKIIKEERFKQLNKLLRNNDVDAFKSQPFIEVNKLVHYLLEKDSKERIDIVAKLLMGSTSGEYNFTDDKFVSDKAKMAIIAGYVNQQILGMPLDKWLAKQLKVAGSNKHSPFTNKDIEFWLHKEIWFNTVMHPIVNKGELSQEARAFYKENVLKKLLPILSLKLTEAESKEVHNLDITQPRWGFIHVGAMVLSDNGAEHDGLTLSDIEDMGLTINTMICYGATPKQYASYLRLPALLYYVGTNASIKDLALINEQEMKQIFIDYFRFIYEWEKNNNPFTLFPNLITSWKTRTELAAQELRRHNVSDEWITSYLNQHDTMIIGDRRWEESVWPLSYYRTRHKGIHLHPPKSILLPNIDSVFEKQNHKLANIAYEVDKLLLPQAFNSLTDEEQEFIEQAQIDRVRIQFNARESINKIPLSHSARKGVVKAGALIYHINDQIDLLACTFRESERIYALIVSKYNGKYLLKRVDRNREALLQLLSDSNVPKNDPDYKLKVFSHLTLKQEKELPPKFIENLAALHKDKLFKGLNDQGYDKTTMEKISDFLLSLVPFYTCITENMKGNKNEAAMACVMDIGSLIPFVGRAALTGMRFTITFTGATAVAFKYGARQTTIKGMLKQASKDLIHHSDFIAKEISPQIAHGLSSEFLSDLDPGFGLLATGSNIGLHAMGDILAKIPNKSQGMIKLSGALQKNIQVTSFYSTAQGRVLDVGVIGIDKGRKIWSQINRETGEFFGQKFIRNNQGDIEVISFEQRHRNEGPATITEKIKVDINLTDEASSSAIHADKVKHISPRFFAVKTIEKRYIAGSNYIQYYTKLLNNVKGSEVIVLSAHGGFIDFDMAAPVVVLPSDITIKMLTPHGTALIDPGLENVVNAGERLRAYVTITDGEVSGIDFMSQKANLEWIYTDAYDPKNGMNVLGRSEGLHNYRHYRFHGESDRFIGRVLIKNRMLAEQGQTVLADILTVDKKIHGIIKTSLEKASVQKVLDLDKAGKLLNEKGERYKTIVFCHCRCDFFGPDETLSAYSMEPLTAEADAMRFISKDATISEVTMTKLHRSDVNQDFEIKHYSLGRFLFVLKKQNMQSSQSPLSTR